MAPLVSSSAENLHSYSIKLQPRRKQLSNTASDLSGNECCRRNHSLDVSPVPYLATRAAVFTRFWYVFSNTLLQCDPLTRSRQPRAVRS